MRAAKSRCRPLQAPLPEDRCRTLQAPILEDEENPERAIDIIAREFMSRTLQAPILEDEENPERGYRHNCS